MDRGSGGGRETPRRSRVPRASGLGCRDNGSYPPWISHREACMRVVWLSVGLPREIEVEGGSVLTSIFKEPVDRRLRVTKQARRSLLTEHAEFPGNKPFLRGS